MSNPPVIMRPDQVARIFPRGAEKVVYVYAKHLVENLETGSQHRVICVTTDENTRRELFDDVIIDGPSRITYRPDAPLPNTDGRGVAVLRTTARVYGIRGDN